jgi:hypothetical protein
MITSCANQSDAVKRQSLSCNTSVRALAGSGLAAEELDTITGSAIPPLRHIRDPVPLANQEFRYRFGLLSPFLLSFLPASFKIFLRDLSTTEVSSPRPRRRRRYQRRRPPTRPTFRLILDPVSHARYLLLRSFISRAFIPIFISTCHLLILNSLLTPLVSPFADIPCR